VRAPQDGQVFYSSATDAETGRPVRVAEGVRVRTFQELARLRDPRQMRAVGRVPSDQAGRITPGLLVAVFLDALPAAKLSGVVDQVRDVSTTASIGPTREVTVCLVDPPDGLKSGMSGEMRISLPKP
jgi:multidrug resistance efflux pump